MDVRNYGIGSTGGTEYPESPPGGEPDQPKLSHAQPYEHAFNTSVAQVRNEHGQIEPGVIFPPDSKRSFAVETPEALSHYQVGDIITLVLDTANVPYVLPVKHPATLNNPFSWVKLMPLHEARETAQAWRDARQRLQHHYLTDYSDRSISPRQIAEKKGHDQVVQFLASDTAPGRPVSVHPIGFELKVSPDDHPRVVGRRQHPGRSVAEIEEIKRQYREKETALRDAAERGETWAAELLEILLMPNSGWEPFVKCTDGEIRRFPRHESTGTLYYLDITEGRIYTSPKTFSETHAGFVIDENSMKGSFVENGKPVQPAYAGKQWEVYRLKGGLHMVPQPNHVACTDVCIKMAALDQGYITVEQLVDGSASLEGVIQCRRDVEDMIRAAKREFGADLKLHPFEVPWPSGKDAFLENLQKLITENPGSYTWSPTPGHEIMLDGLERVDGQWKIGIRDPFHARQETITENPSFWCIRGTTVKSEALRIDVLHFPRKDNGTAR